MAASTETVYLGYDNTIDLILKADGVAVDLSSVTRITLDFDGTIVDSDVSADAFDWNTGTTGKISLSLGQETISVGTYNVQLVVYDPDNTHGVVWGRIRVVVQ